MDVLVQEVQPADPMIEAARRAAMLAEQEQTATRVVQAGQAAVSLALSRRTW